LALNDIDQSTLSVSLTDRDTLASAFVLKYGYHIPTRKFTGEKYVNATATNITDGTQATNYKTACLNARTRFLTQAKLTFEAPHVWSPAVADRLLRWYCDQRRTRRVVIEFDTFANGLDMMPGHVLKMSDDIGNAVLYPGLVSGANWSTHQFNVVRVEYRRDVDRATRVHVVAVECYTLAPLA